MKLVELIIDILDHSETPLKQGEILACALNYKMSLYHYLPLRDA
jgi:hypothetical protein